MDNELPDSSKIKLITTDLDGTLLNSKRKVSNKTSSVVRKILKKYPNLHFVLATGRAKPATKLIREKLGIDNRPKTESLLCNGCLIYDSDGAIIWQNVLPQDFILNVHRKLCEGLFPECVIFYSSGDYIVLFQEEWAKFATEKCDEIAIVEDMQEYTKKIESGNAKINKIGFMVFEPSDVEEIVNILEGFRKECKVECSRTNINFLEYMPPNTNKGTGLAQLIKNLGIKKEEVLAFGDGGNDLELLKNAGWPVAMENACEALKPLAKLTAKSNAEDGVADMLERIFLK